MSRTNHGDEPPVAGSDGRYPHVRPSAFAPRRGDLRILLGAAPGVGKTYAMLREAQRLRDEGRDVVIGFIETHGRPETAVQIGDLEVVPRAIVTYQGIAIEEMDVEAAIRWHPEIVLVDELAHTNAPGLPRPKRYQDVDLIRDRGINVISALNIQHVASLQDVAAGITGIDVRESVPDQVLVDATDIQLFDVPVEALIERIEQGKVYPPANAIRALQHFFQPGNLTALREMALRRTAEGVDAQLSGVMLGDAPGRSGDLVTPNERVIVLITDEPGWGDVVRTGWRLASAFKAELVALAIAPLGLLSELPAGQANRIREYRALAEDLGARIEIVSADGDTLRDDAEAIVRAIHAARATILVVGVHPQPRPRKWLAHRFDHRVGPGLERAMEVLQIVEGVDIHLVKVTDPPPVDHGYDNDRT
ncbi:MAG: sensor histidine kinase KdpD [Thermomicrobiales bacterium]